MGDGGSGRYGGAEGVEGDDDRRRRDGGGGGGLTVMLKVKQVMRL